MKNLFTSIILLAVAISVSYAQKNDSIKVSVKWGAESQDLRDFYRFEGIDQFNIKLDGEKLKGRYYTIIAKEYWNKKLAKSDTLVNTKAMGLKIDGNNLTFGLMSKKTDSDSVKMLFSFPNFGNIRKFSTTKADTYSLRDPSNGEPVYYSIGKPFTLFAYSLPYIDPKRPGAMLYCELSKNGEPADKWGEIFNINHYITFEMVIK